MKNILLIILLAFSFNVDAAKFGERDKIVCDGVTTIIPSGATPIVLRAAVTTGTNFSAMQDTEAQTSTGYEVPTGKTLTILCYSVAAKTAIVVHFSFGHGSDSASLDNSSSGTDPQYMMGETCASGITSGCSHTVPLNLGVQLAQRDYPMYWVVEANRFPFVKFQAQDSYVVAWGYLTTN